MSEAAVSLEGLVLDGRYHVDEELGRGGMGVVYRAHHVVLDRKVAIKVLHKHLLQPTMIARFEREAETAGKLNHPNVVPVIDVAELPDGRRTMVMDFVFGVPMDTILDDPSDPDRVLSLIGQLCDGLAHAHGLGLVHRDLKPENVMIERDAEQREVPRIIDFGIAVVADVSHRRRLTEQNLVMGTPAYMAPEQAAGQDVDARSDQFALGIMFYELLAGTLPFDGEPFEIARSNIFTALPAIAARAPTRTIDPAIEAIVRKMTAKQPSERYADMTAVRAAIDALSSGRRRRSNTLQTFADFDDD